MTWQRYKKDQLASVHVKIICIRNLTNIILWEETNLKYRTEVKKEKHKDFRKMKMVQLVIFYPAGCEAPTGQFTKQNRLYRDVEINSKLHTAITQLVTDI